MGITYTQYRNLAEANDGCASLALARRFGVAPATWRAWRRRHELVPILRGAAALDPRPGAATLLRAHLDVLGEGAVLGGRSALWALTGCPDDGPYRSPRPLEVVLAHDLRHRPAGGVRVRRCRNLLGTDRTESRGWACTSGARTAVDLIARLDERAGRSLLIDLVFHRVVTPLDVIRCAQASPTAPGAGRTQQLASQLLGERSDSVFEWLVRRSLDAFPVQPHPGPYPVAIEGQTFEVDIAFPEQRVAIECDGGSHLTPTQQRRDARKSNAFALSSWRLLRTTYAQFVDDPEVLLTQVRRALVT